MRKINFADSPRGKTFLKQAVASIIKGFKPNRILLFGSYAYGQPTTDSDLDLLIIKDTRLPAADRSRRVSRLVGRHTFPMDLIVLTPTEIRNRLRSFDPFLEEVLARGRQLYVKNR